jgi:hypothetical protein
VNPARHRSGFRIAVAAILALTPLAGAPGTRAGDAQPSGGNLEVNPKLARPIPPPGWLADHREDWVKEHAVYRETCRSSAVIEETWYLNRIVGYDEYLMKLTQSYLAAPVVNGEPATASKTALARATMVSLRNDISAADSLAAQLQAIPACNSAKPPAPAAASATTAASAAASVPPAAKPPAASAPPPAAAPPALARSSGAAPAAPQPAPGVAAPSADTLSPAAAAVSAALATAAAAETVVARATAEPPAKVATEPAASPATPAAERGPAPDGAQRLVIHFVENIPALTPSGVRALDQAVAALRAGKKVELAIDGCDAGADFSNGSPCARRRLTLRELLTANGVRDPTRALSDIH